MASVCFYLVDPGRIPAGGWLDRLLMEAIRWMGGAFFLLATTGYLVGVVSRRRVRGPSLEFVNYFYWLIVCFMAVSAFGNPGPGDWIPAAGAVVVTAAGTEQFVRRTRWSGSSG